MPSNGPRTHPRERFWKYVRKTPTCWLWIGKAKHYFGYGIIQGWNKYGKKSAQVAHRVSYEIHNGKIPKGKSILHICDNPPCVNPNHLKVGTQIENLLDCKKKGRVPKGEKHWSCRLSEDQVLAIRELSQSKVSNAEIMKVFNLKRQNLESIIDRRTWTHI